MIKTIFFGTPELCIPYLDVIIHKSDLCAVVTHRDKPVGRRQILTATPVCQWAEMHNIKVFKPEKISDIEDELRVLNPDLFIVVAYGSIIPESIITIPRIYTINIHYSLLPRFRGASPVEACILAGDSHSGVCIQKMRYILDSGPILRYSKFEIPPDETAASLKNSLFTENGVDLLSQLLDELSCNKFPVEHEQEGEVTYCKKIVKSDGELLPTDSDEIKWRKYRAYIPWPGVFYFDGNGRRVKINEAKMQDGHFTECVITYEGSKPQRVNFS